MGARPRRLGHGRLQATCLDRQQGLVRNTAGQVPEETKPTKMASEVLNGRRQKQQQREECTGSREASIHHFLAELRTCRDLKWGKNVHLKLLESGTDISIHVATALLRMYAKCGSMGDAHRVFNSIRHPDLVSWTALLLGYAENGEGLVALDLFSRMKYQGCAPDSITYVAALKACASLALKQDDSRRADCLERGKLIHSEIGCHMNLYVQNTLVDMYAKCGSMPHAQQVFDNISNPSVVSWNALLSGYADCGEGLIALDLFAKMKSRGFAPNSITYVASLKACTSLAGKEGERGRAECLAQGKRIHSEIGCHLDLYVQSVLVDMYAKCGSMVDAHQVFDSIRQPDVVSWTALVLGYAEHGEGLIALDLFFRMKSQGCAPDSRTFVAALKACSLLGALEFGRKIHAEITLFDAILVTSLVDFYAKCGSLAEAQGVFDFHSQTRDLTTWTALLSGYCSFGEIYSVFGLLKRMQDAGFQPNGITFQCILTCCSHAGLVEKAREWFEAMSTNYRLTPAIEHYTCMVDVLGRANKLDEAIVLLQRMPCIPNAVTWMTVLSACCKWKNIQIARLAFNSLVGAHDKQAAACVLMAHIYASRGMWQEQEMVMAMRRKFQASVGTCSSFSRTNAVWPVRRLLPGDPQIEEILKRVEDMDEAVKEHV